MNFKLLLEKKKYRERITKEEFDQLIRGVITKSIPEYQLAALLMAIYFNGLDDDETFYLTEAMLNSGKRLSFDLHPLWDKHSTGGVGDKISLVIAPILAAFDIKVPMISGRGLGHTGGTIDKLESIPGFRSEIPIEQLPHLLDNSGFFIISQSDEIAPADRQLYALRDATQTVDSIPLIVASILSKKLAVNTDGIIIDVKCGGGAFMRSRREAETLASLLKKIGERFNRKVVTLITAMDQPLGRMVGNSLEVIESIEFLKGNYEPDTKELVVKMVQLITDRTDAEIDALIRSGRPLELMKRFIEAQGGNPEVVEDYSLLPQTPHRDEILSPSDGWIAEIDARRVGMMMVEMGGGRRKLGEVVDHRVGFEFLKKVGDRVERGETIALLHHPGQKPDGIDRIIRVTTGPVERRSIFLSPSSSPTSGAT
ncbi:thymidine phosphorylase [candidate division WOR-3 bacterium]|uniref:Thymidine phosphorylase n=1 Tax=candidate division WOR-3 bacterium TaxID=2052148 RepID=A0A660SHY0_UNCW3|nr:MAG: thymidine phosphorylase [candidate division WOR-3 bacterium]